MTMVFKSAKWLIGGKHKNYKYLSFSKIYQIAIQLITLKFKRKGKRYLRHFRHTKFQERAEIWNHLVYDNDWTLCHFVCLKSFTFLKWNCIDRLSDNESRKENRAMQRIVVQQEPVRLTAT